MRGNTGEGSVKMDYNIKEDLKSLREMLELTQAELASELGIEQVTIARNEAGTTIPSQKYLEKIYSYAFAKGIHINRLKEMLWTESLKKGHRLLFHGAKSEIVGEINVTKGRTNNDFGRGFYTGENYQQAVSFVSGFPKSCIYLFDFDKSGLVQKKYEVDQEWMMTIAYYRGVLDAYKEHPFVENLVKESKNCDYIIAPIADNRMFQIINSFIEGEITDEQCKHCLAATNLGYQYVFCTPKSVAQLKMLEKCYLADNEKNYFKKVRSADTKLGNDKVKMARIKYRGKGKYIDEILT